MAAQNEDKIIGDIEEQKEAQQLSAAPTRPGYLDESIVNLRVCCPSLAFKLCPCCMFSCFSAFCALIMKCILAICRCFKSCFCGICDCFKGCCRALFGCLKKCIQCPKMVCIKICTPILRCFKCICNPFLRCFKYIFECFRCCMVKLNCCNISCGLPCRNPPGCVCLPPGAKTCGFGITCPYSCFSCGWKHCCKMPKDEQNWWFSQKVSASEAKQAAKDAAQSKKAGSKENEELRAEVQKLQAQLKELQVAAPAQEELKVTTVV